MYPEYIWIFLKSAPLAVMEDVQLCFLWRESRERAHSPCRRGLQVGRALKMLAMVSLWLAALQLIIRNLQLKPGGITWI